MKLKDFMGKDEIKISDKLIKKIVNNARDYLDNIKIVNYSKYDFKSIQGILGNFIDKQIEELKNLKELLDKENK